MEKEGGGRRGEFFYMTSVPPTVVNFFKIILSKRLTLFK